MANKILLGIDCGGTHTDAALLSVDSKGNAKLLTSAKTSTDHDNLAASIIEAINLLKTDSGDLPATPESVTIGATLQINAIIQNRIPPVGLALAAGPGLDPLHFALGAHVCIVPGGLDHRGIEVSPLYTAELAETAKNWSRQKIGAIACVGKFSPRNPAHEQEMAAVAQKASGLPVITGHSLSGSLNFPRRIATAYYSAAIKGIHDSFLNSVEQAIHSAGINAQLCLLKADGGAIPFSASRNEPAQSILSGPAASVMGSLALCRETASGCVLLLDMGGTTTDLALLLDGSPVVDRRGMKINGRRTLVRSLASVSIGVGGDSAINVPKTDNGTKVIVGPVRLGPAMAFGGQTPTLLDALNYLDQKDSPENRGAVNASIAGIAELADRHGMNPDALARQALDNSMDQIVKAAFNLVEEINSRPVYTIAALKTAKQARPSNVCIIGGPASAISQRIQEALGIPAFISPHADVANAIGAALTLPTASLEIYADTGKKELSAPAINYTGPIPANFTLEDAKRRCKELLESRLLADGITNANVQIVEADLFATLDDRGLSAKDMRVISQARPGIMAKLYSDLTR